MFGLCVAHSIQLEIEWIPRNMNTVADELSKIYDYDDWGVSDKIFECFNKMWGGGDILVL